MERALGSRYRLGEPLATGVLGGMALALTLLLAVRTRTTRPG
jgi:hypothetical protein